MDGVAGGAVERITDATQCRQRLGRRRRSELPKRGVERFAGDILLRQVRRHALDAGRQRGGHAGMTRLIGGQVFELDGKLSRLLGRDLVETERLDGDQPPFHGVVCAKYGTEAAGPNLMQDSKGTEGSGWGLVQGSVSVQR